MTSRRKPIRPEEAIDFVFNSNNSDCDHSVGDLSSDYEDDLDYQLENNILKDLR